MFDRFLKPNEDQYFEILGKIFIKFDPSVSMEDVLKAKEEQVNFLLTRTYDLYLSTNNHRVLQGALEQPGELPVASGSFGIDKKNKLRFDFSSDMPHAGDLRKAVREKLRLFLVSQGVEAR